LLVKRFLLLVKFSFSDRRKLPMTRAGFTGKIDKPQLRATLYRGPH
jgi:hypothetical protein